MVGNAQRILELANDVVQALNESEHSAFDQLASVHGAMEELSRLIPDAETWKSELDEVGSRLQELAASLKVVLGVRAVLIDVHNMQLVLYQSVGGGVSLI